LSRLVSAASLAGVALAVAFARAAGAQNASPRATIAVPSAAPAASPSPVFGFVYKAPPGATPFPGADPPTIDEIDVTNQVLVAPGPVSVRIYTSPAVVSVTAETLGYVLAIPAMRPGVFGLDTALPDVPKELHNRTFDILVTATTKAGRTASVVLPFSLK
jgi:hypothetical protein